MRRGFKNHDRTKYIPVKITPVPIKSKAVMFSPSSKPIINAITGNK
jgi:hypothetical protein